MVDLTRRKTVIGLGLMATGSGATFTSAAFSTSTTPYSDLRLVVDQELIVEKGKGFDPTDPDYTADSNFFTNSNTDSDGDIDDSDTGAFDNDNTPLAYVNDKQNDELVIKAAQTVGGSHTFQNILKIRNQTTADVDVGIAYDRNDSPSQYGAAIEDGDVDVSKTTSPNYGDAYNFAQKIYEFQANSLENGSISYANASGGITNNVISPDPDTSGNSQQVKDPDNDNISNNDDLPAAALTIPAGDTLNIDLVVDPTPTAAIEPAVNSSKSFGKTTETVDILNEVTVGTFESTKEV